MDPIQYGVGALLEFPLVEDGDADFVTDYTPAAGDAKIWSNTQASANPTSLILGFDSLSEIPAQGATIEESGAGTAEGVVEFTVIISGTVGGGTAAGFFFMRSVTGQAWSNDDVIDINGGTAGIADADSTTYDLAATAGLIGILGNGQFVACLSPTEATCKSGHLTIVDSATKAVEDQSIPFRTAGNASAYYAYDPFDSTTNAALSAKADSDAVLADSDHDKTQSDIVLLSSKADSDQVLNLADHDKTQSDVALLSTKADSDMALGVTVAAAGIQASSYAAGANDAAAQATDAAEEIRDHILPTQNVALSNIPFVFRAASDHITPVTGATGTGVTRSIDGGAFGAGGGTINEVANGLYSYDASQADMNGGIIMFRFTASGGTPGAADDAFVSIITGGGV